MITSLNPFLILLVNTVSLEHRITIDIFEPNFCWRVCDCLSFSKMSKLRSAGILLQERLATRREAALADMAPLLPLLVTNDTQGLVLIHKASSWYTRPCLDTQNLILTQFEQYDKEKRWNKKIFQLIFFVGLRPSNLTVCVGIERMFSRISDVH